VDDAAGPRFNMRFHFGDPFQGRERCALGSPFVDAYQRTTLWLFNQATDVQATQRICLLPSFGNKIVSKSTHYYPPWDLLGSSYNWDSHWRMVWRQDEGEPVHLDVIIFQIWQWIWIDQCWRCIFSLIYVAIWFNILNRNRCQPYSVGIFSAQIYPLNMNRANKLT
jgi:hypothetical protein